jgi:hypothetical protein
MEALYGVTTLCERFGWFPPGQDATAVASDQEVREWRDAGALPEAYVSIIRTVFDREPRAVAGDAAAGSQLSTSVGWLRFRNGASTTLSALSLRGAGAIKGRVSGFSTEDLNAPVLGQRSMPTTRKDRRIRLAAEPFRNGPEVLPGRFGRIRNVDVPGCTG